MLDFIRRLFGGGDALLEKAIELAIAEEQNRTFGSETPVEPNPQVAEVKPVGDVAPATVNEPIGLNSPILTGKPERETRDRWVWKSDSIEFRDAYVQGSLELFSKRDIIGKIKDFYISSNSSSITIIVDVDGNNLYNHTYTQLASRSRSDGRLEAYQDNDTNEYVVTLSDIYFAWNANITIYGSAVTLSLVRTNYEEEVKS